jgi:hypothetical protein
MANSKTLRKAKGRTSMTLDVPDELIADLIPISKKYGISIRQIIRNSFKLIASRPTEIEKQVS